ncbi:MAG: hypothetical protein CL678_08130 [Bdellovibrionaceae bacterium]|nr:hypothetical protein [Pseudobdellovibrionaceae bacterium]|tara:strand:- start:1297 stop:2379 length:1083 start_codon:yes stop_codon:yes gene_type:complete
MKNTPSIVEHHLESLTDQLKGWQSSKKIPPVLLLTGIRGVGKSEIALFLAKWMNCESVGIVESELSMGLFGEPQPTSTSLLPCGTCPSCMRIQNEHWLDLIWVKPETHEKMKTSKMKIDALREVIQSQGKGAREGAHHIIVIQNAEQMTPQAANSILKIMEEPPLRWIFILTAPDASLLLPTIVSRCQRIALKPMTSEKIKSLLKEQEVPNDRISVASELSEGSYKKALELTEDDVWKSRQKLFRFLDNPFQEFSEISDWACQSEANFHLLLDQFEHFIEDCIRWTLQPQSHQWKNTDGIESLCEHTKTVSKNFGSIENSRFFWMKRMKELSEMRKKSEAPLNRKILTQEILHPWIEAGS